MEVTLNDVSVMNTNANNKELALKILQEKSAFAFEGGGVLGIGHAGALYRLKELGGLNKINHVTGASVGSIMAAALACGATTEYIKDKMINMDVTEFEDGGNIFKKCFGFLFKYGIHPGDVVERFAGEFLEELTGNTDITFKEAYDRFGTHLTINYLSLLHEKTKYADHIITPNLKIKTAIRWSSSIPLFYQPGKKYGNKLRRCTRKREILDYITDGGVMDNYPIHVLKDQKCKCKDIIGFKLCGPDEKNHYQSIEDDTLDEDREYELPTNIWEYGYKHVNIIRKQALRYHVHKEDWKLTVKIDIGNFETTDFDIVHLDKMWLFKSGMRAIDKHLEDIEELLNKNEYPL